MARIAIRPKTSSFRNTATNGNVGFSVASGGPIDIVQGNTPSVAWWACLSWKPSSTARLITLGGAGAFDIEYQTNGNCFMVVLSGASQNVGGLMAFDNQWHHYALTEDGANLRGYRDRVLIASPAFASPAWTTQTATGALFGNNNFALQGNARDVMLWKNYVLTQTDVDNLYYAGTPPATAPSAWWACDDASGASLADSSGNGLTGTIVHGGFTTDRPAWAYARTAA